MSAEAVAGLRSVAKRYGPVRALRGIDLELWPSAIHALLGENGSGKSTAVKILSGAVDPDEGTVTIGGKPVSFASPRHARLAGIATTYQDSGLVPHLSVADNILLGTEKTRYGILSRNRLDGVRRVLAAVQSDVNPAQRTSTLPAAARQLVAIAKAILVDARVLILDEPTATLPQADVEHLFSLLDRLRAQGYAVLYISHRLSEVERLADTITVLKDGGVVSSGPAAGVDEEQMIQMMIGREVSELFPELPTARREKVLVAEDIASHASGVEVDRFEVRAGEIVGVAGLDGSGRSPLLRMLAGIDSVDGGSLDVRLDVALRQDGRPRRRATGYVPPDRIHEGIIPTFSVASSATQASLGDFTRLTVINTGSERRSAKAMVKSFGVKAASLSDSITSLSGGNQQKVVLGRALLRDPAVLICDEPTAGVDVGARQEIYRLIAAAAADGLGVVVASSDLQELLGLCHRIVVLRDGTVATEVNSREADEEILLRAMLPEGVSHESEPIS